MKNLKNYSLRKAIENFNDEYWDEDREQSTEYLASYFNEILEENRIEYNYLEGKNDERIDNNHYLSNPQRLKDTLNHLFWR